MHNNCHYIITEIRANTSSPHGSTAIKKQVSVMNFPQITPNYLIPGHHVSQQWSNMLRPEMNPDSRANH